MSLRAAFISVVPSPYQRDLFAALASRPEVQPEVFYLEAAAPDSPWPEKALAPYETILPGRWFALGSRRIHVNWHLPDLRAYDVVVLNTLMSATGQWLMRAMPRGRPWFFWGERLGRGGAVHRRLAAPLHRASGLAAIGELAFDDYRAPLSGAARLQYSLPLRARAFLHSAARGRAGGALSFLRPDDRPERGRSPAESFRAAR